MKKGVFITLIIVLVVILALAIFLAIRRNASYSPPQTLEECQNIYYNGENGINVLIFSNQKTAKLYADKLLALSPFSSNKQAFNFYFIDSYKPSCNLYQSIALLCYSPELIKKASSCPSDYIVIIQDADAKIRSSAYMNVVSLNSKLPQIVFAHEFGHVFGNLADEYIPSQISKGSENCAQDCSRFGSDCFEGCSKEDYYRSIDSGLMRTLSSSTFGRFNEGLISQRISKQAKTITASAIAEQVNCENEKYYLVEGNYSKGNITIISQSIEPGCLGSNGIGPFNYTLILEDNSREFQGEFNAELVFTDTQAEQDNIINGEALDNEGIFLLKVPVVENAKSLELSTETLRIEVPLGERGARPCEIK
jgi:hypothetical protein